MMIRTLAAGVALAVLVSGAASAAPQAKGSPAAADPKQPIPYSQLDAYLKASPKQRASKDWWSGSASTGMSTDTSATAPAASTTTTTTTTTDSSVNPPASTSMPSDSSTSMPSTPPTLPDASSPAPGSNLPGSTTTPGAPTEPK
jgi:molybdate transport system ATP-binding protein